MLLPHQFWGRDGAGAHADGLHSFTCGACGFSDLTASHLGLKSTFGVWGVCPSFLGAPSALTLPVSPHPCVFTPLHLSAGCWDQRPALCSPEHRVTSPAAYWTGVSQALGQNPSRLSQGPLILSPPNSQRLNSTSGAQLWFPLDFALFPRAVSLVLTLLFS